MKKLVLYILALAASASCYQKAEYNQTLGLLSEYNVLSNAGGSTQVAVFSNTAWSVEMDRQVSWASIDRFDGIKSGYLVFDYEINYGRARRVILVFKATDANGEVQTRTLNMYQQGRFSDSDCIMALDANTIEAPAAGTTEVIPFSTNLVYNLDEMFLSVSYPEGQEPQTPWITLKSVEKDKITIEVLPNTATDARRANIRLAHTDAGSYNSTEGDTIYSNTVSVLQAK